jgi:hypothetical protein
MQCSAVQCSFDNRFIFSSPQVLVDRNSWVEEKALPTLSVSHCRLLCILRFLAALLKKTT